MTISDFIIRAFAFVLIFVFCFRVIGLANAQGLSRGGRCLDLRY